MGRGKEYGTGTPKISKIQHFSIKFLFAFFIPRSVRRRAPTLVYNHSALATGTSNHAPAGGSRIDAEHIQI